MLESSQARGLQSVGVNVDSVSPRNILEETHSCVFCIFPENVLIVLSFGDVHRWVLKNASVTIGALGGALNKILADRGQILFV